MTFPIERSVFTVTRGGIIFHAANTWARPSEHVNKYLLSIKRCLCNNHLDKNNYKSKSSAWNVRWSFDYTLGQNSRPGPAYSLEITMTWKANKLDKRSCDGDLIRTNYASCLLWHPVADSIHNYLGIFLHPVKQQKISPLRLRSELWDDLT